MKFRPLHFLLLLILLSPVLRAVEIVDIQVRSQIPGRDVELSAVKAFVQPKINDEYNPAQVNQDIRSLQETGRYAYVGAEIQQAAGGIILIYVVEERPRLRSITVEGAEHFSNEKVRDWMELNLSDRVDIPLVMGKLEKVREKYQKDFYTGVDFEVDLTPPDDEGFTRLTLTIDEGPQRKVKEIRFPGRIHYTRTQLKRVMGQKETWILSAFTGRGKLDESQLRQDLSTLEEMYRRQGYLDAKAGPYKIEDIGGGLKVSVPITPYDQYLVNSIQIEGNTLYPSSLLGAQVPLQVGGVAASDKIQGGRSKIRDFYNNRGFSETRVTEKILLTAEERRVDIIYTVNEGRVAKIRDVLIRGNTRTKDEVIRRELLVYPGDVLNEVLARKSSSRLRNLGFLDSANYTLLPTDDPGVYDVEFEIQEGRSGQFLAGVGFSSEDKLVGFVELSQGNFDIGDPPSFTGGGQKLKTRLQLGTERRDIDINYVRPWFFNRRLTLSVTGFQNDSRFYSDDYDQRNTGFSIGIRKALSTRWRGGVTYTLEEIDVYDVDEDASEVIAMEEGKSMRSGLDFSVSRDSRNEVWIPTRGGRIILNTGFTGGPLGFDESIYEVGARSSYYYPVFFDHVLNLQGWARSVDYYGDSDNVPIFDRLFLGGSRTIRGFEFREVSPVDDSGDFIGGQTSLFASAEYTIPLSEMFRYAMFYDWGVVNLDSFDASIEDANSSYGIGLRIDMPGFPLRFDYSWQAQSSEANKDSGGLFSFLIGYSF
ncbi:outer membrane protein assembly factor BamA [Kiritimatiellaeota bacterium B1221]|nr:outer membrane protein assembly factor BamA [Kiritimatiellaeota bacterium B1221]